VGKVQEGLVESPVEPAVPPALARGVRPPHEMRQRPRPHHRRNLCQRRNSLAAIMLGASPRATDREMHVPDSPLVIAPRVT